MSLCRFPMCGNIDGVEQSRRTEVKHSQDHGVDPDMADGKPRGLGHEYREHQKPEKNRTESSAKIVGGAQTAIEGNAGRGDIGNHE